ncbi:MAG: DUF1667 domain-containing protein [Clostridia bacterium]|nr:DUF1667 domain-containing protein [Clostridia bacterium]
MKERILTCIICPRGCTLRVTLDEAGVPTSVEGNACPRGKTYAETECTAPMRTVTSTVRCTDGSVIPVKTDRAIPKRLVFDCMKEINLLRVSPECAVGDILIEHILGTDASLVVTGKKP